MNVSGSQASIMVTVRSGSPWVAAVLAPPPVDAAEPEATADGLRGVCEELRSADELLCSQPAVRAAETTIDAMTGKE